MTQDDVIRLAREAGFQDDWTQLWAANFERFIDLAVEAKLEKADRMAEALKAMLVYHDDVAKAASQPLLDAGYEALAAYAQSRA